MRKKIAEETTIFLSVAKWIIISTCTGAIVGAFTTLFLKLLQWSTTEMSHVPYYFLLLPVVFLISYVTIKKLAPDAMGHGTEKVIEAIHKNNGKIKVMVVPVKIFATIITLAVGGSAGKEGPCAQIGAGISSFLADVFRFDDADRKKIVICGISAGFASVFGTPIAGAIFGVEVLVIGSMLYEVLLPSFVSGIMAFQVSSKLGIAYFYHPISFVPVFTESFFLIIAVAGIFFGLCSFLLIEVLIYTEKFTDKLTIKKEFQTLIGGSTIVILAFIFSTKYLGLGLDAIENTLEGGNIEWYAFLLKILFTSITLNYGGSGGIITPIFFIGVSAGNLFAKIWGLDPATFSAIGMVSLLAGAANTPIAASIMSIELFGPKIAPYAAVSCVISFLMTGHRSVYPSQFITSSKIASIQLHSENEIENLNFTIKRKGVMKVFMDAGKRFSDKRKNKGEKD
ncbi:MAG: chloride channel protein [Ignavibacteria bacterium]|nr:chloride channel protein [Ignavibacteria bacterium]